MEMNFEPANPDWCYLNTILEMEQYEKDKGIELNFKSALDREDEAVKVVKFALQKLS